MTEEEKKLAEQKAAEEAKAKADAEAAEKAKADEKKPKPDSEKTVDELKAEADAAEAAYRAARDEKNPEKDRELRENYIRSRDKHKEKLDRLNTDDEPAPKARKSDIAVEDLVTLEVRGIDKNSDEAKILKRYVEAGIVGNYKEGLNHVAVKAELDALKSSKTAKAVIDENDTDEVQLKSKKEIVNSYKQTGEVPTDKKAQAEIAKNNLKEMGL